MKMKKIVKSLINKLGYDIHKKGNMYKELPSILSTYHSAILGLASQKHLNIVIIGANDGKTGDPIYEMLHGVLKNQSKVTLIEPQESLVPEIEKHYEGHPDFSIINGAIGADNEITLYAISESVWRYTQPKYAVGWPIYRAPTGITSSDPLSVANWGRKFISDIPWKDEYVVELKVPGFNLKTALQSHSIEPVVDILQIDVEGFDDIVLEESNIDTFMPSIILFEAKHLPEDRLKKSLRSLAEAGYYTVHVDPDILAFKI